MITTITTNSTTVTLTANDITYASYLFDEVAEGWVTNAGYNTMAGSPAGRPAVVTATDNWTAHVRLSNGRLYSLAMPLVDGVENKYDRALSVLELMTVSA